MDYSYPISPDWSTEEIITVIQFFESIEQAYEKGIKREVMLAKYGCLKKLFLLNLKRSPFFESLNK